MDIGEISIFLPSVSQINDELTGVIKTHCTKAIEEILSDIAETYRIPIDELNEKYLKVLDFGEISVLGRGKKSIDTKTRCCAKTSKGRCTRKRKTGLFCGSHEHSRPYGEIDDSESGSAPVQIQTQVRAQTKKKPLICKKPTEREPEALEEVAEAEDTVEMDKIETEEDEEQSS